MSLPHTTNVLADWHPINENSTDLDLGRVDLMVRYDNAPDAELEPDSAMIIPNALLIKDITSSWWYLGSKNIHEPLPDNCTPIAWRQSELRESKLRRVDDIQRMLDLLEIAAGQHDPSYYVYMREYCRMRVANITKPTLLRIVR